MGAKITVSRCELGHLGSNSSECSTSALLNAVLYLYEWPSTASVPGYEFYCFRLPKGHCRTVELDQFGGIGISWLPYWGHGDDVKL